MRINRIVIAIMAVLTAASATAQQRKVHVKRKIVPVVVKSKEEIKYDEMLESTRQVMFIDSVVVDKQEFLNYYKLNAEAGTISGYNQFFGSEEQPYSVVYVNQLANKCWFSNNGRLYTSDKLGTQWSEPILLDGLGQFQRTNYPYVLSDGTTLYFSAISNEGLGGLDIYVSRYDSESNKYLLAENIGLPFNSEANDYMYAVDELNGIGYFATDRRQPEGKVCIYTFIPDQKRTIYSTDEYDKSTIRSRARIDCIADTWGDGMLRAETLDRLNNAGRRPKEDMQQKKTDFLFVVNDDIVYTNLSDFRTRDNRERANKLVEMRKAYKDLAENLDKMRVYYATKADIAEKGNLKKEILGCEQEFYQLESDIRQLEKAIRYVELNNLNQ